MASPNHLKRLAMPRSWPLPRKTSVWVSKPKPGAHSLERGMPLNMVMRDVLGVATSNREVRHILNQGLVSIDGRVCKETRRSVGLMDVLTLEGKTTIKGGKTQLNLHDGRNVIVDDASAYSTNDALKLALPSQDILEHITFAEGTRCFLIGGVHVGTFADVREYIVKRSSMANEVQFDEFGTTVDNVFAVGKADLPVTEVNE
jgi:small subunit ribosomal protein S4e